MGVAWVFEGGKWAPPALQQGFTLNCPASQGSPILPMFQVNSRKGRYEYRVGYESGEWAPPAPSPCPSLFHSLSTFPAEARKSRCWCVPPAPASCPCPSSLFPSSALLYPCSWLRVGRVDVDVGLGMREGILPPTFHLPLFLPCHAFP